MLKYEKLERFNRSIFKKDKLKSKNRSQRRLTLGFFKGNEILFIGQNPGVNRNREWTYKEFDYYQKVYVRAFHRFKMGKYLLAVCKRLGLTIEDISFTNVVKYATKDNKAPAFKDIAQCLPILEKQIKILKPKKIVCIGRLSHGLLDGECYDVIYMKHPASHYYNKSNIKIDADLISLWRKKI